MFELLEGRPSVSPHAFAVQSHDPPELESFDDDLAWIIGKLVARTGGAFGVIVRYNCDEQQAEVLARTDIPCDLEEHLSDILGAFAKDHSEAAPDVDDVSMRQYSPDALGAQPFRALTLRFQPTARVTLHAVVYRADAKGPFNMFEEGVARTLYPVLARYVRLWWLHRTERRQVHAFRAVLDLSDIGVILLNRRGELMFANVKATALLDARDGLQRIDGSIAASHDGDGVRLQAVLRHAVHRNVTSAGSDAGPGAQIVALERHDRRKLLIAVTNVRRAAIDSNDAAVILYVLDPHQDVRHLLAPVCGLYRLTGAETRLVYQLVAGLNIIEAASKMGVQPHTARAYLKQVFGKTNTHRQSDLIRIMLSSLVRTNAGVDLALS